MEHDTTHPLVPRPAADIVTPGRRTPRVVAAVTGDILARARAQDLDAARVPLGAYRLRAPDYRQILRWAEGLDLTPEAVLERLAECRVEPRVLGAWEPIAFVVEDGAILSLAWDFERLPMIPGDWEAGLRIRQLGLHGRRWQDPNIPLRPSLANLNILRCGGIGRHSLDLSLVRRLTKLNCGGNELAALDLAPVPGLTKLNCSDNLLRQLTRDNITKTVVCA